MGWVFFVVGFLVFVFFVFFFVFLGGGVGGSGTPWVVTCATSWLLPDNTGSLWEISNFGRGYKPSLLFSIAKMKTQCGFNFDINIYNFMIDSLKLNSASYETGTFL